MSSRTIYVDMKASTNERNEKRDLGDESRSTSKTISNQSDLDILPQKAGECVVVLTGRVWLDWIVAGRWGVVSGRITVGASNMGH